MKKGYNLLVLNALGFFVENPYEEIHLREFSRRLKISVNSSQRFLGLFLNEGLIKDTLIPQTASSIRIDSEIASRANLEAQYAPKKGTATLPDTELIFTIRP